MGARGHSDDLPTLNGIRNIRLTIGTASLPAGVSSFISGTDAEGYQIIINDNNAAGDQEEAFLHECLHIWRRDTEKTGGNVQEIENACHRRMDEIMEKWANED